MALKFSILEMMTSRATPKNTDPRTSVSNNFYIKKIRKTWLKLNENRFQELVKNCGMRYQLSSEPYQNSFYEDLETIIPKIRKYYQ